MTEYTHNRAGLVTRVVNRHGNDVLSSFDYIYYLDGNTHQVVEEVIQPDGTTTYRTTVYVYDQARRLVEERQMTTSPASECPQGQIFQVWSHVELQETIQYIATLANMVEHTIQMMQDFTATGATIIIPTGVNVVLTSYSGNVFTYTRSTAGRHFSVHGGALTLRDVIICGGSGIHVRGGIDVAYDGRLTLDDGSEVTNNRRQRGGGIFVFNHGLLVMLNGSRVANNHATGANGGGVDIWQDGPDVAGVRFIMYGGIIEGNTARISGGGVSVNGSSFDMYGGTIRNNSSNDYGGGVFVRGSTGIFDMQSGIIDSNTSARGGGIFLQFGSLAISGTSETSIISNNAATVSGGGIYIITASHIGGVYITGGTLVNNRSDGNGGGLTFNGPVGGNLEISGGFVISDNHANFGGGIWITRFPLFTNWIRVDLRDIYIQNNHAVYDGGGIFTERAMIYQNPMPEDSYTNISIMPSTHFSSNTAGNGSFAPPSNAAALMPRAATVSAFDHQLNNYDINFGNEVAPLSSRELHVLFMYEMMHMELLAELEMLEREHAYNSVRDMSVGADSISARLLHLNRADMESAPILPVYGFPRGTAHLGEIGLHKRPSGKQKEQCAKSQQKQRRDKGRHHKVPDPDRHALS